MESRIERARAAMVAAAAVIVFAAMPDGAAAAGPAVPLATPESFATIVDPAARSAALFTEVGRVLTHPRCVNCHPVGDRPLQGESVNRRLHQPPVARGADGFGTTSMRCASCHQNANYEAAAMPGHTHWHLAPPGMAWQDKSLAQICAQIKDPARNGGRTLAQIHEHIATDSLVGWAWAPGFGRAAAPGTQAQLGALVDAWIRTGATCPA